MIDKKEHLLELINCKNQSGRIDCEYENECDASYNFENMILKIIEGERDGK